MYISYNIVGSRLLGTPSSVHGFLILKLAQVWKLNKGS